MGRRPRKRKALMMSDVPSKRRCPGNNGFWFLYYLIKIMDKPISSGSKALLMMIIEAKDSYMKETRGEYQFINTCVPDTLLASFHILYIKYLHIRALLTSDDGFRRLMQTLNEKKYTYARALWIRQLEDFNKRDLVSYIKDHFPIIDKLVCAKVDGCQKTPNGHPIYEKLLSKFWPFGDLRVLGDVSDPDLILVHRDPRYDPCIHSVPPLAVVDDFERTFELEILLVGKDRHMYMCFKLYGSIWILYDNTQGHPFKIIDFKMLYTVKDAYFCLAIYVNTTKVKDYKQDIPETTLLVGTRPFALSRHQKVLSYHVDEEAMQDLQKRLQNLLITN